MDHLGKQQRKPHPRDTENIFIKYSFFWALELYRKGFKRDLVEADLYEVPHNFHSKQLADHLETEWNKQKKLDKNLSIVRLLWKCYGLYYLMFGLVDFFAKTVAVVIQPYALGKLISYFVPGQTDLTANDVYFYAALVIGVNFVLCIYRHNFSLILLGFGIRVRTALCSFIYRRALKLSPAHLGNISIGKIVTIITKDVDAFEVFIDFANEIWIAIIKTFVICGVLYYKIGISAFVGVGFFFIVMPLQIYLGRLSTPLKMKMCKKTDERLQITQEVLSAIRIIKMYTWEKFFNEKITATRKREINSTFKIFFLRFLVLSIGSLTSHMAFYLLLITYLWLGNSITAETVYYILTLFQTLSFSLSVLFPIGIYQTAELMAAIKRVGNVVKTMELQAEETTDDITILPKIIIKNVSVNIQDKSVLREVNLKVEKGLTLITGAVGSGKSFLLKTILKDYKPHEGCLIVEGSVSYAPQQPWLFPSSIRQNILFGQRYEKKRYQEVLKVCALLYDFELLEEGDGTIVEDRGINLSRGQQARINLARAVYKKSDIYLLDDALSALDAHVSEYIYRECILKFLQDKLVILVTHNMKYIKDANNMIILDSGEVKSSGMIDTMNEKELDEVMGGDKSTIEDEEEEDDEETKLITETTTEKKVYQEKNKTGDVDYAVYKKYIHFGGGFVVLTFVFVIFAVCQFVISYTDKLVSSWVNLEQKISNFTNLNATDTEEFQELNTNRNRMFYMYSIMTACVTATTLARGVALFTFAKKASINLHKYMITNIINASMEFFDTNFIGNILNRFSKDLATVDEMIPYAFYHVFRAFLMLTGIITLIAWVNVTFLIPTSIFLVALVILRTCIIRTSRSLKRLDAATKSPIIGHLNATLEGLTTIRAFKAEAILRDEFDRHQDLYTSASFIMLGSMRTFAFALDILCILFIAIIVIRFLVFDKDTLAGNVGLAISQAFMMTGTLQWGIRQWAEIENRMTSVERVLEYTKVRQENNQGQVLEDWPKSGEVKYENVNLIYTNSNECVLKNIDFVVNSREKVGIVGRTGAGKSSIIATLFRLYDIEGRIVIDGVDIKTLSLDFLRSHISIIPQDPVLFSGSIRDNIDPVGKYSDEEIWKAIDTVDLKRLVPTLDMEMGESGANFSVGQRQLICLARAIVRNNKVIVLDEATANMDAETDTLIHETIQKNFDKCTVFTIAHKLKTIMHSDKIMVLDKGQVIEFDHPDVLLKNTNGRFYKMVKKSGLLPQ